MTEALVGQHASFEAHYVGGSDDAYWGLLRKLWLERETFCIVEHDVVLRGNTLAELEACESPWCAFPVPYMDGEYAGLACVKFDAFLIASAPQALDDVALMENAQHPRKHWCMVDAWLQGSVLPRTRLSRHVHQPALRHVRPDGLSPWPSHGCHQRRDA